MRCDGKGRIVFSFGTYNLYECGNDADGPRSRRADLVAAIRALDVDVLAIQEIGGEPAFSAEAKEKVLDELAAETGMCCRLDNGRQALAVSESRYGNAVMWNPETVDPVDVVLPGTASFQNRVAGIVLDFDGRRVAFCSYHAYPTGTYKRIDDAQCLAMALTRSRAFCDAVVGGDFNDTSASKDPTGKYLDEDYYNQPWTINHIHEAELYDTADGEVKLRADRRPDFMLTQGGLVEVAELTQTPEPTSGHGPEAWADKRRKDRIYVTQGLVPAVHSLRVVRNDTTLRASDHLPVVVVFDPAALATQSSVTE
jgi:endonuclease/exonuclease/phosphatase family metal-dependent hydrolase